jgi:hypothetical protein
MKLKMLQLLVAVTLFVGVILPLQAASITIGIWNEFSFADPGVPARGCLPVDAEGGSCSLDVNSVFAPAPPWTFIATVPVLVTMTDAFFAGDAFRLFDFGSQVLDTNSVPFGPGCSNIPEACLADPNVSHGVVLLGTGPHSLTATAVASPFGAGAAFYRVDLVPEPASLALSAFGMLAMIGYYYYRGMCCK